jgi:hypothetical protein
MGYHVLSREDVVLVRSYVLEYIYITFYANTIFRTMIFQVSNTMLASASFFGRGSVP